MKKIITLALVAAFGAFTMLTVHAADPASAPVAKKEDKAARPLPFHGKLDSVDKNEKSIKIGDGRTFQVLPTTRITKDGAKPGTLEDAKVGEDIAGAFREVDGGKLQLVSLRLGPKPEKKLADGTRK
jgi:hypothetical protein